MLSSIERELAIGWVSVSPSGEVNITSSYSPLAFQMRDARVHGLDGHHHPGLSAERIVVYFAVAVCRIVSEIVDFKFHKTFVPGSFEYRAAQRRLEHFGENGYNIDAHKLIFVFYAKLDKKLYFCSISQFNYFGTDYVLMTQCIFMNRIFLCLFLVSGLMMSSCSKGYDPDLCYRLSDRIMREQPLDQHDYAEMLVQYEAILKYLIDRSDEIIALDSDSEKDRMRRELRADDDYLQRFSYMFHFRFGPLSGRGCAMISTRSILLPITARAIL